MVSWRILVKFDFLKYSLKLLHLTRHKASYQKDVSSLRTPYHQTKIQPCVIQKATTLKQITSRFPGKCKQIFTKCRPVKRCRADSINLIKNTGSCGIRGGTVYPQRGVSSYLSGGISREISALWPCIFSRDLLSIKYLRPSVRLLGGKCVGENGSFVITSGDRGEIIGYERNGSIFFDELLYKIHPWRLWVFC